MEISAIFLIGVLFTGYKVTISFRIVYFVLQSIASGVILFPLMIAPYFIVVAVGALQAIMFLKLALYPLFVWYFPVLLHFSRLPLFIVLAPQKMPPLVLNFRLIRYRDFVFYELIDYFCPILILGLFLTALGSLLVVDLRSLLIWSSLFNTRWLYVTSYTELPLVILYFLVYSVFLGCLIYLIDNTWSVEWVEPLKGVLLLVIVGFPPFPIFFLKLGVI